MADVFGRNQQNIQAPITADRGIIDWGGGMVTSCTNISIGVAVPVQMRHTIGNQQSVIYAGQPSGTITINELLAENAGDLFGRPGWNVCQPTSITVSFASCSAGEGISLRADGCVVTQYSLRAEAEGLTVLDAVTIQFLQLTYT